MGTRVAIFLHERHCDDDASALSGVSRSRQYPSWRRALGLRARHFSGRRVFHCRDVHFLVWCFLVLVSAIAPLIAGRSVAAQTVPPASRIVVYRPAAGAINSPFIDSLASALTQKGHTVSQARLPGAADLAGHVVEAAEVVVAHGVGLARELASRTDAPILVLLDACHAGVDVAVWMRSRQAPTLPQCLALSAAQWLTPLRRLIPAGRRLGVVTLEGKRINPGMVRALVRLGVQLTTRQVRSPAEVPTALRQVRRDIDALWAPARSVLWRSEYVTEILRYSLEEQLPVLAPTHQLARSGFLASVEVDREALLEVLVAAVERLARRQPAEVPGLASARPAVNVETARRLGLRLDAADLGWARVIYPYPLEVQDLLDRYGASFANRDSALYRNVFWDASARQMRGFARFVRTAKDIRVRFETREVEFSPGHSRMRLHLVQVFDFVDVKSGRSVSLRAPFQFHLERRGQQWRVAALQRNR